MEIRMSQITGEEVSVKSYDTVVRVVVPLSTADGARVLCAAAQPSVSLSEALSGQIRVEGSVKCCVISAYGEQQFMSESAVSSFECNVPAEGVSARARILASASCCDCRAAQEGSNAVVTARIRVQVYLSDPAEAEVVTQAEGEELYTLLGVVQSTQNVGDYRARFGIKEDITLSVRLPQIDRLLCCQASPVLQQVNCDHDQILIQGTLAVNLIYACADEFEPVAQIADSIEFSKIITASGVQPGDDAILTLSAEDCIFTVEKNEEGEARIVSLEGVLAASATAYRTEETEVVTDAYSSVNELDIMRQRLTLNSETALFRSRQSARISAQMPAGNPPMARISAVIVSPCVEEVIPKNGGAVINGTAGVQVLYIASESGDFAAFSTVSEFSFTIDEPDFTPDMAVFADVRPEQIQAVLTGMNECELHLTLAVSLAGFRSENLSVLTELSEAGAREESDCGICIYIMQKDDTLWDVGKELGVSTEMLRQLNPEAGERPAAGTRLTVYRQIKP